MPAKNTSFKKPLQPLKTLHPSVISFKRPQACQKTLKQSVSCSGIGTHTGISATITLKAAPQNTGIIFIRTDLKNKPLIPALSKFLISSTYAAKIGLSAEESVSTIEHLMAALSALEIDNAFVEIDGPEVPIMDGSSAPFLSLLKSAGLEDQTAPRKFLEILKTVEVSEGNRCASISPADCFSIEFDMHFRPTAALCHQKLSFILTPENFERDLADARTFGFYEDAEILHKNGLALGTSLSNSIVFKEGALLNAEGLRHEDECVRHKVLDVIGDLALAGYPLKGQFYGNSSGHSLNHRLLAEVLKDPSAWRIGEESSKKTSFSKNSLLNHSFSPSFALAK